MKLRKNDAQRMLKWFREEELPVLRQLAANDPERMAMIETFEAEVEETFAAYLAE